ncbi:flavin-containing monooxygenase [Saccharopolyspora dendranthemae]|uniref:Cation diffusion facilitator CzcD-associated flavoprotein CzcO n=1 Tax=Saccharopolyspora dendranthemae TaxID=1181886 RepID=A0A561U748_9PSEU|nr:NAD(P)/FAD-dependent oxidoreductase [Saccharopolyspora dendranthemae]TWF95191.1 cation diffusion facilitator CzcD-associated flavoprotein CzcO [Saccharopolyspora dendranthemae]
MLDVIVIGAGFSGLCALHRLRGLGMSALVLEAGDGVGGTWYWNRYPGARCDSESYYYSFSFDEDLQQEWRWSERYPAQPEVLAYLDHVADRFDLRRDIRLGTTVVSATFDEGWTVLTATGERLRARFLISAVGCLSSANVPELPGLDSFAGDWYHTGRWPHEDVDFTGRRVGVIGTGSTGIQAIPVIAEQAAHLAVFQRTPNFSVPARNAPLDEEFQAQVRAEYGEIRALQRETSNGHPFRISPRNAVECTAEERREAYEAAWERGGLRFRAAFNDLLSSEDANDTAAEFIRGKIRETVRDPEVAERLLPRDHPFAAKRPPIDTGYFETYNRDDVTLVDLRETPIVEVTRDGLRTTGGEHPLDALVFATGFDAMTGPLLGIDVRGPGGTLAEKWRDGPRSYLGLQVAGFPNLFTITGPGSPSVLTNMPTSIEQHVDWIARCLEHMRQNGFHRIEATEEAERDWGREVREAADRTLLPKAESSWYLGANVPGKPRVFMPYAGGLAHYATLCDRAAHNDYEGFHLT